MVRWPAVVLAVLLSSIPTIAEESCSLSESGAQPRGDAMLQLSRMDVHLQAHTSDGASRAGGQTAKARAEYPAILNKFGGVVSSVVGEAAVYLDELANRTAAVVNQTKAAEYLDELVNRTAQNFEHADTDKAAPVNLSTDAAAPDPDIPEAPSAAPSLDDVAGELAKDLGIQEEQIPAEPSKQVPAAEAGAVASEPAPASAAPPAAANGTLPPSSAAAASAPAAATTSADTVPGNTTNATPGNTTNDDVVPSEQGGAAVADISDQGADQSVAENDQDNGALSGSTAIANNGTGTAGAVASAPAAETAPADTVPGTEAAPAVVPVTGEATAQADSTAEIPASATPAAPLPVEGSNVAIPEGAPTPAERTEVDAASANNLQPASQTSPSPSVPATAEAAAPPATNKTAAENATAAVAESNNTLGPVGDASGKVPTESVPQNANASGTTASVKPGSNDSVPGLSNVSSVGEAKSSLPATASTGTASQHEEDNATDVKGTTSAELAPSDMPGNTTNDDVVPPEQGGAAVADNISDRGADQSVAENDQDNGTLSGSTAIGDNSTDGDQPSEGNTTTSPSINASDSVESVASAESASSDVPGQDVPSEKDTGEVGADDSSDQGVDQSADGQDNSASARSISNEDATPDDDAEGTIPAESAPSDLPAATANEHAEQDLGIPFGDVISDQESDSSVAEDGQDNSTSPGVLPGKNTSTDGAQPAPEGASDKVLEAPAVDGTNSPTNATTNSTATTSTTPTLNSTATLAPSTNGSANVSSSNAASSVAAPKPEPEPELPSGVANASDTSDEATSPLAADGGAATDNAGSPALPEPAEAADGSDDAAAKSTTKSASDTLEDEAAQVIADADTRATQKAQAEGLRQLADVAERISSAASRLDSEAEELKASATAADAAAESAVAAAKKIQGDAGVRDRQSNAQEAVQDVVTAAVKDAVAKVEESADKRLDRAAKAFESAAERLNDDARAIEAFGKMEAAAVKDSKSGAASALPCVAALLAML